MTLTPSWVRRDGGFEYTGLRGLPEQWKVLLKSSNISKDMAMKNKEALVDCFTYMEEQAKQVPLPKMEDFIRRFAPRKVVGYVADA